MWACVASFALSSQMKKVPFRRPRTGVCSLFREKLANGKSPTSPSKCRRLLLALSSQTKKVPLRRPRSAVALRRPRTGVCSLFREKLAIRQRVEKVKPESEGAIQTKDLKKSNPNPKDYTHEGFEKVKPESEGAIQTKGLKMQTRIRRITTGKGFEKVKPESEDQYGEEFEKVKHEAGRPTQTKGLKKSNLNPKDQCR